ncbi:MULTISPECIES: ABC transporter ATP-binding protein [unclassified Streptomyces]|uniref:ABC transporter ATP-binding protein n=1 Tax=unclassified Streptomyces TaxID=2593676 RepID=UPI001F04BFBD|nr:MULTISPECIES: ABC transporter ATP-binding protein [unclassified Streptomyces]MCH0564217.1 ABC transporter ATP-binding protein [Streptomyces sp. MUM 2J]MCH0568519.1 ABC transporter ATP-binding protein [Streptomyces sp. MUM 136J]
MSEQPSTRGRAPAEEAFLNVSGLHAGYGQARVLQGLDFSVARGEVCAILGPNGAGKTTTLRALCGMVRGRGSVTLDGTELLGRSPEQAARLGVAHVPEGRGTFNDLTVEENLRVGAHLRTGLRRRGRAGRAAVAADLERVHGYFPVLRRRSRQAAGSLSGGEQQMLAIGRALMLRPALLLLDEPSLGLAPLVTRELFEIVRAVNEEERTTVVVVEQNAQLALDIAHRAHVLEAGRLVLSGPAAQIREDGQVAEVYLGVSVRSRKAG